MTIDEAIAHAREVAEKVRKSINSAVTIQGEKICIECAEEHEQLAEWLEDYKRIKMLIPIEHALKAEYNKAIDDIASELENHSIYADIGIRDEVKMEWVSPVTRIKEIAEQLKAGGENEKERNAFDNAKQIVQEVAEEFATDTNVGTNSWIPCSDRLPEEYGDYLVWWTDITRGQYYEIVEYEPNNGWIGDIPQSFEGKYSVIAWQQLPEPYKESEDYRWIK